VTLAATQRALSAGKHELELTLGPVALARLAGRGEVAAILTAAAVGAGRGAVAARRLTLA
jgi:hypothetical protein